MGIFGGHLVGVSWLGVDNGTFWSNMTANVDLWKDVINSVIWKSAAFGAVISLIAVFQGYTTAPTSEGVAYATTRTVVASSIAILALDFVLTAFLM
jgi:phospholipid/cholesterol/gamma-HCH transport system permease protein